MEAATTCPKCGAAIASVEKFCGKCGYQVQLSEADRRDIGARVGLKHEKKHHQQRIKSGRTTILVVGILMLIGAVVIFLVGNHEVKKARRDIDAARGNPMYDQDTVEEAAKENRSASRLVPLISAAYVVLAAIYVGLWVWARTKPLPATLAALILYVTLIAASVALDPKEIVKGIIIKIIIIAFLVKAVDSARKYQKMQEHGI